METRAGGFRADVQGLRALAVIAVVLYHVDRSFGGGFVGVDVFFVISGFVIAGSLLRRSDAAGRVSLGDFYRRRAMRILPALVVFLVGSFPLVLLGPASTVDAATHTAAAAAAFVANMQLVAIENSGYFSASAESNPYLHLWSLSVEEQFYLGFPLLMSLGLWRSRERSNRSLVRLLVAAMIASFLLMMLAIGGGRLSAAFYLAPTRAWEFLAGALVAVVATSPRTAATASALRIGGLAAIIATMIWAPAGSWPGPLTLVTTAGAVAVISAGGDVGLGRGLLTHRSMVRIGTLSYSWYLWHWPFVVTAQLNAPGIGWLDDLAAVAALVPAWVSWRFVEEPLRRAPLPPMRTIVVRTSAALAAVAAVALLVIPEVGDRLPGNRQEMERAASVDAIVALDDCPSGAPVAAAADVLCGESGDPTRTVVLVGDSFAGQIAAPLSAAARASDWTPVIRTRTACAFIPGVAVHNRGRPDAACDRHVDAVWRYLQAERPAVVVISNRLAMALTESGKSLSGWGSDAPPTDDVAQRRALVRSAYTEMVETLSDQGTEVVLVRGTPETEVFALAACPRVRWVLDPQDCGRSSSLEDAIERRSDADAILDGVQDTPGLAILDFDERLCPDRCEALRDTGWVYADHGHITARFARTLEPVFRTLFGNEGSRPDPARPVEAGAEPESTSGPAQDAESGAPPVTETSPTTPTVDPSEPSIPAPALPLPPPTRPVLPDTPTPDVTAPLDDLDPSTLVPIGD